MDLFRLAAKIELDDTSYNKGISQAESAAQKFQSNMSAMSVAMGTIAADLIRKGVSAVTDVIGGAVDAYADYEQLVGGVETLFKDSSGKVQKYAQESYKTAGLSANQYMETVTSFSASLLQGLGGDTDAAADLANMAITDMADNANKMGTDMTSIQNAYQGFAKQNYTMLDNLKLGYGGTKEEMVRLINDSGILKDEIEDLDGITFDQLVLAIHEIQTEMGITGTTAKEAADTISGSKASLAAAWQDLLSAVGGEGDEARLEETLENFKTSFSTYMENFIPALASSIANSGSLVTAIGESISNLSPDLLSDLITSGLEASTGLIDGLSNVVQWLIDSLAVAFGNISTDSSQLEAFASSIGSFVGETIVHLVNNLPTFIKGLADAGLAIAQGLVEGIIEGLTGENSEASRITESLQESITSIDADNLKATGLIEYMDGLIAKYGEAAAETEEWKAAQAELEQALPGAGQVFEDYGKDIGGAVDQLKAMNQELRNSAIMNALQKASQEELELLTAQTLEYNKQRGTFERNQAVKESAMEDIIGAIQDAARAEIADLEGKDYLKPFEQDRLDQFTNLINGFDLSGLASLEDLDLSSLWSILNNFDIEEINGRNLEAYEQIVSEAQINMDRASAEMVRVSDEISATKDTIAQTDAAMAATVEALMGDSASITIGGEKVYDSLASAAEKIGSVTFSSGSPMPEATGMDYVPYDGFTASLHRGERIVTASDNKKMSSGLGMDFSGLEASVAAAVKAGMQGVTVRSFLNGQDITDEVNRNNINALKARRYGA